MEIEPCSSHTSANSILHCVNRPAKPLLFFLLEKFAAEGYGGGGGRQGRGGLSPEPDLCNKWSHLVLFRHVSLPSFENMGLRMEGKRILRQISNCLEIIKAGGSGIWI